MPVKNTMFLIGCAVLILFAAGWYLGIWKALGWGG
jgi:hypothetical protein